MATSGADAKRRERYLRSAREIDADAEAVRRKARRFGWLWLAIGAVPVFVLVAAMHELAPWLVALLGFVAGAGLALYAVQSEQTANVGLALEFTDWPKVRAAISSELR